MVCRAHQVVEKGFEFYADKKLVTVFSAPNYCNQFDNAGAMMIVDENLVCGFKILIPKIKNKTLNPTAYKQLIRNKTPPPKNKNFEKDNDSDDENEKNKINDKILCMHGGLSPDLTSLDKIRKIVRPTEVPDKGLLCDLLWSDPDKNVDGWGANERGVSFTFDEV